jgi:hypothetical protein
MPSDAEGGDPKSGAGPEDVALIHGVTPEGDLRVLRKRADRLELGAVRQLREGVPIVGEVVRLTPRKEFPLLCDVETTLDVPAPATSDVAPGPAPPRKGPAQVATDEYRRNWDVIWSRPAKGGLSN